MKKLLKTLLLALMCVIFGVSTIACGGGNPPPEDDITAFDAETQAIIDGINYAADGTYQGNLSIRVVNVQSEKDTINQFVAAFKQQYPNINVTINSNALMDNYYDNLPKAFSNGQLQDIFWLAQDHVDTLCYKQKNFGKPEGGGDDVYLPEMFVPLSALDEKDNSIDFETDLAAGALSVSEFRGQMFMLPRDYNQVVMYYDKDWFDIAGVQYPSATTPMTGAEFKQMLINLRNGLKNSNQQMASGVTYANYFSADNPVADVNMLWDSFAWPLIKSFGGQVIDSNGEVKFNSDQTFNAINYMNGLKKLNLVNTTGQPDTDFKQQKTAVMFHSRAVLTNILAQLDGASWGPINNLAVAPVPNFGGTYSVGAGASGYAISRNAQDKTAAWLFLKFVVGQIGQQAFGATGNGVPVRNDLLTGAGAATAMWKNPYGLTGLASDFNHDVFIANMNAATTTRDYFQYAPISAQSDIQRAIETAFDYITQSNDETAIRNQIAKSAASIIAAINM